MNFTLLEVLYIYCQHLLQLGCGSTVIDMGSLHSCFPSSANLIWIKNGHPISFMERTVAPCWGITIKPAGSRLTHQIFLIRFETTELDCTGSA